MGRREVTCPVCQADMPLAGDERAGDEFFCGCCGSPGVLAAGKAEEELEVEEDF